MGLCNGYFYTRIVAWYRVCKYVVVIICRFCFTEETNRITDTTAIIYSDLNVHQSGKEI